MRSNNTHQDKRWCLKGYEYWKWWNLKQKEEQQSNYLGRLDHNNTAWLQAAQCSCLHLIVVMKKKSNPVRLVTSVILHALLFFSSKEKYPAVVAELALTLSTDEYPWHFVEGVLCFLDITGYSHPITPIFVSFSFSADIANREQWPSFGILEMLIRHSLTAKFTIFTIG